MSKEKFYPPEHLKEQFHCPHCWVFAKQFWGWIYAFRNNQWSYNYNINSIKQFNEQLWDEWTISKCEHCWEYIFWLSDNIIYPKKIIVPLPNNDLEEDIKEIYLEAANIFQDSVRASAALLRLALQKLCIQLWWKWKKIDEDIKYLVSQWLSSQIQKSLDILRITWNNAVHPWKINLEENSEIVLKLFYLINLIAEKMITEPKEIDFLYDWLPEWAREAIEKRDNN